jgi:hypothetical protein
LIGVLRSTSSRTVWRRAWLLGLALALASGSARAADRRFIGVGFEEFLSGGAALGDEQLIAGTPTASLPISVLLIVERSEVEAPSGSYDFSALDARIARYRRANIATYVELRGGSSTPAALDAWGRFVRAVATRYRGTVRGYAFGFRSSAAVPAVQDHAFFVKTTAINVRAGDAGAATIMAGVRDTDAAWLSALYLDDVAPYLDAIGLVAGSRNPAIFEPIDKYHPSAEVVLLGESLGQVPADAARVLVERQFGLMGTRISTAFYRGEAPAIAAASAHVGLLRGMLGQELVAVDEPSVTLRLTRAGAEMTSQIPHHLLFGLRTLTNYLIYSSDSPLELTLSEPTGVTPAIVDALTGGRVSPASFAYDAPSRIARLTLPPGVAQVVDWSNDGAGAYSTRENVSSTVMPSVSEIVARQQQAQTSQDAALRTYIARATMEQHFRSTALDAGFDVVTENRFFVEGHETEWVELSFRLNGTKWGDDRPPFPLLQAEKVLSLPLDLRLSSDYRYRLTGVDTVDGRPCFVLRFDPVDEERSLYRGTVWIDRETYVKVKSQTIQTRLSSPVVSSEEIQYFSPAGTVDGRPIQLLTRLVGRQIMLVAGRNLLVERGIHFDEFELNTSDFTARRESARSSDHVMYRDTSEGLRYLVKRDGQRVVQDSTATALAGLIGVTYEPSHDYPLPLIGLKYLDFNFRGKGNQLALVFGGVLALVNLQRPKLFGHPHLDASLDLFAIAVKGNDRTYDSTGERLDQRLTTRPFSTGINVGWQFAEFQKLLFSYQFRFDAFAVDPETSAAFRPPVSTATNGVGVSWEWKQGGFSFLAAGTQYGRVRWEPWGDPGDYRPEDQRYSKYSAGLSRDYYFGLQKVHLNAAYYGGHDLDRFSSYQFGMFDDNKVHGVPSAGVRFGELGMLRGSYSFNLLDQYRLDVFVDQAVGRDAQATGGWQNLTGLGIGGSLRGPRSTLLRIDIGKSFLAPQYRQPGTLTAQLQILKPL